MDLLPNYMASHLSIICDFPFFFIHGLYNNAFTTAIVRVLKLDSECWIKKKAAMVYYKDPVKCSLKM
jgi:hypothetical protein